MLLSFWALSALAVGRRHSGEAAGSSLEWLREALITAHAKIMVLHLPRLYTASTFFRDTDDCNHAGRHTSVSHQQHSTHFVPLTLNCMVLGICVAEFTACTSILGKAHFCNFCMVWGFRHPWMVDSWTQSSRFVSTLGKNISREKASTFQ
jgi:flagellar biosynthesis protein FliQ